MKLYNSRFNKEQEFSPLHGSRVGMYSCGPTVYNHAHIGNLSSYIYADTLRRTLKAQGYDVHHIMNFTDVDDKTIRDSHIKYPDDEPAVALKKLTSHYEKVFLDEMAQVGNNVDDITFVRATDNIADIQKLIKKLLAEGVAYLADDGVYFSINEYRKTRKYGQLSHVEFDSSRSAERIDNDEYDKDNAHDFALWKRQKPGEPAWDFVIDDKTNMPGRPGWHIECSVMSVKNLGQPFDIHTGGVDLKFPHHENEIAQSTAGDQPELFANFFVHNEHLLVNGEKMSKSAHNFYVLSDLTDKHYSPLDFRMLVLQSHYRKATNFSWENLTAAKNRLSHWRAVAEWRYQTPDCPDDDQLEKVHKAIERAQGSLENDLDTAGALRCYDEAFDLFTPEKVSHDALAALIQSIDQVLGLKLEETTPDISAEEYDLIDRRQAARQSKDWATSDRLRDELKTKGIEIQDGAVTIWSKL